MSRASSWAVLARDRFYLAFVAVTATLWLAFFVPLLHRDVVDFWTPGYSDLVFLALVVVGLGLGQSKISRGIERVFWRLLLLAAGLLWAARALGVLVPADQWGTGVALLADITYLCFYVALFFAASLAPHRATPPEVTRAFRIQVLAVLVTLLVLLTYFVFIPARIRPQEYFTYLSSLHLFVLLDLFLVYLFARLRRECRDRVWRSVYTALLLTSTLWAVADLVESFELGGYLALGAGGPMEVIWVLPGIAFVAAARLHRQAREMPQQRVEAPSGRAVAEGFALIAVILLPTLHFALGPLGAVDPAMRPAREVAIIAALLILGLLAWLERHHLRRERQRQEVRLRESEARYRTLVEHAPEAILIFDPELGHFVDVNQQAVELFGRSREELLQTGPKQISPGVQPGGRVSADVIDESLAEVLDGRPVNVEWVHFGARGRNIFCEVHLTRIPPADRPLVRASVIDVTERKRLETALVQAQKMESIGRLAGGVAHDFNNLLTVINGYAHELLQQPQLPDDLKGPVAEIASAGERAEQLTSQLLTFSRERVLQREVFDVNRLLPELTLFLRRLIGENIELSTDLCSAPCYVQVDKGQLEQAIVNLAVNAQDAMPGGGVLQISTVLAPGGPPGTGSGPDFVEIRVADSGIGMDPETLSRAFDPFFTTKRLGEGTGLGLSTVYGFASQVGGTVHVSSRPGEGTTFCIRLPRCEGPPPPADETTGETAAAPAEGTILLVEDEQSVRELLQRVLRARGYRVLTAGSAEEAREQLQSFESGVDLLLTDMVLRQANGLELARELRQAQPRLPVLLISGYMNEATDPEALAADEISYLGKPFTPEQLLHALGQALGPQTRSDASG